MREFPDLCAFATFYAWLVGFMRFSRCLCVIEVQFVALNASDHSIF